MREPPDKRSLLEALDCLPIFPLPHVVLFPGAPLPLHIFEPRYRRMLADCMASHGAMAIARLAGGEDELGRPAIAHVAGGGVVVQHEAMPDGRSNVIVLGQARLRLEELPPEQLGDRPYRCARAVVLEDLDRPIAPADRTALVGAATMFTAEVKKHDANFRFSVPVGLDAARLADVCAYQLVVDAAARQAILEELDPRARVQMVIEQLASQQSAMPRDGRGRVLN